MVAEAPDGNDLHIGADAAQALAQDGNVNFHMVLHGVGFQSPDVGENGGLSII